MLQTIQFLELHQIVDIPCGRMVSDEWTASWDEQDLELRYDPAYLKDIDDCEARAFPREKRNEALTLIHSLEMRQHARYMCRISWYIGSVMRIRHLRSATKIWRKN